MPNKPCSEGGETGVKWGDSGKCYTGPGSADRANKQAAAAYAHGYGGRAEELQEEIDEYFEEVRQKEEIDPDLQQMIDVAKSMTTWELIKHPPWNYEEDFSPDLFDIDVDVKNFQ